MPTPRTPRALPASLLAWLLVALTGSTCLAATVTFRVQVPASTPPGDTVYIAGNFQGWNPGSPAHALAKQPDGRWQITLTLPDATPIQYKFTRGSWETVEKGAGGEEIPNRTHTPSGVQTVEQVVLNWAGGPSHTIVGDVESFQFAPFLGGRRVWVYLPPGYDDSAARYPVLYMHDGQNLFDAATSFAGEWKVDEACEALIGAGEIEPIIVVGIENGPGRITEYTPWPDAGFGGGGGDAYLQAIRDVLVPEIDARYRTRPGAANRYMCGSSLGGLISVYAGYAYADDWSRIAGVSSSYWWDDVHMVGFAQATGRPAGLARFYHDHGTAESGIANLRAMRDVALAQGFVLGADFMHVEAPGHGHDEASWALRFPDILRFLVDAPATCAADCDASGTINVDDVECFAVGFLGMDLDASDCDGSGTLNVDDVDCFVAAFLAGC